MQVEPLDLTCGFTDVTDKRTWKQMAGVQGGGFLVANVDHPQIYGVEESLLVLPSTLLCCPLHKSIRYIVGPYYWWKPHPIWRTNLIPMQFPQALVGPLAMAHTLWHLLAVGSTLT